MNHTFYVGIKSFLSSPLPFFFGDKILCMSQVGLELVT